MRKKLEAVEIWFYKWMLIIPWTERVSNKEYDNRKNASNQNQEKIAVISSIHNVKRGLGKQPTRDILREREREWKHV